MNTCFGDPNMKYYGVIVDMLTRTTDCIAGEYESKPDKEFASQFCYCKWFGKYQNCIDEILSLKYEIEIIKMFQNLDSKSPSIFSMRAKMVTAE